MILAPVVPVGNTVFDSPVTVRLIGVLDRVLIENFAGACAGLMATGGRTLVVLVRDLTVMQDDSLNRFLATLTAYRAAGHRICVNGSPTWRKIARARGADFAESTEVDGRQTRRQIIICHSMDKRAGAA